MPTYSLDLDRGQFALGGQAVGLVASRVLAAAKGGFLLGGQAVGLTASRQLALARGHFALTGNDAELVTNQTPMSNFTQLTRGMPVYRFHREVTGSLKRVKAGTTDVYQIHVYNPNASVVWLQMLDGLSANLTLGTHPPRPAYPILASSVLVLDLHGDLQFDDGLMVAVTTTRTGSTSAGAASVVTILYR